MTTTRTPQIPEERAIQQLHIPHDPAMADAFCQGAGECYLDGHPLLAHEWLALILLAGHLRDLRPAVWPPGAGRQPATAADTRERAQNLVTAVCQRVLPDPQRPTSNVLTHW